MLNHSPLLISLHATSADVVITDPQALVNAAKDLNEDAVTYEQDPYEAAKGAHAIAVMTEWQQYRDLDFVRIHDSMVKPAFIFDGRNLLNHKELHEIGFNVYPIGKAALTHLE